MGSIDSVSIPLPLAIFLLESRIFILGLKVFNIPQKLRPGGDGGVTGGALVVSSVWFLVLDRNLKAECAEKIKPKAGEGGSSRTCRLFAPPAPSVAPRGVSKGHVACTRERRREEVAVGPREMG